MHVPWISDFAVLPILAGLDSKVGSVYRPVFGSLQVPFPGPAPFTSCHLLVKGQALSTG